MNSLTSTVAAGDTSGRPVGNEHREHSPESVLSLESGAGPEHSKGECMALTCSPGRPVRFADPKRNAAYWARIDRIVSEAPPLSNEQRAVIRTAFHAPAPTGEAA